MGARRHARLEPTCAACGAAPHHTAGRFCGSCGAPTTAHALAGASTAAQRHAPGRRRLRVGWGVLGLLVVAGVAVGIDAGVSDRLDAGSTVDTELAAPDERPEARRFEDVDPDAARELQAATDPDRLRCEPAGCERWFRSLSGRTLGPMTTVGDGLISLVDDDELLVLEVATGEQRLRIGVDEIAGQTRGSFAGFGLRTRPTADGVLVIGDHRIALIDLDGQVRWRRDHEGWLERHEVAGEHLFLGTVGDDNDRVLATIQISDGELVASLPEAMLLSADPPVIAALDGDRTIVTRLAPGSLTDDWRTELPGGHATPYGYLLGEVLVVDRSQTTTPIDVVAELESGADGDGSGDGAPGAGPDVAPPPELTVLAPDDGSVLARLPGGLAGSVQADGMAVLLLAAPDTYRRLQGTPSARDQTPFDYRVVVVGAEGIAFDAEVQTPRSASPEHALWVDEAGVILAIDDAGPWRLDLETGRLVDAHGVERYRDVGQSFELDATTTAFVTWGPQGLDTLAIEREGRRVTVVGDDLGWPMTADGEVLVVGERSLLLVDPSTGERSGR